MINLTTWSYLLYRSLVGQYSGLSSPVINHKAGAEMSSSSCETMSTYHSSSNYDDGNGTLVNEKKHIALSPGRGLQRNKLLCITILSLLVAVISATLIWLGLAFTVPRVHQPFTHPNALNHIVANWMSPEDSVALVSPWKSNFSKGIIPLACHSHNDYWRTVPLFEALAAGCTSVEADIHLPIGSHGQALLVGHSPSSLKQDRTLRNLYLKPLAIALDSLNNRHDCPSDLNITRNWNGIFQSSPGTTLTVLLDFNRTAQSFGPMSTRSFKNCDLEIGSLIGTFQQASLGVLSSSWLLAMHHLILWPPTQLTATYSTMHLWGRHLELHL